MLFVFSLPVWSEYLLSLAYGLTIALGAVGNIALITAFLTTKVELTGYACSVQLLCTLFVVKFCFVGITDHQKCVHRQPGAVGHSPLPVHHPAHSPGPSQAVQAKQLLL